MISTVPTGMSCRLVGVDFPHQESESQLFIVNYEVESMAHWYPSGRIPKYFYGLAYVFMDQPKITDLNV